jgi:hypothetical protein
MPKEERAIAIIDYGRNGLDNDYTVYKSGKVLYTRDYHAFSLNNGRWLSRDEIDNIKNQLYRDARKEDKEAVKIALKITPKKKPTKKVASKEKAVAKKKSTAKTTSKKRSTKK